MLNLVKITAIAIAIGSGSQFYPMSSLALIAGRSAPEIAGNTPTTGKVVKLTSGDLMCYVDLIDARGRKHNIGADFAICERTELVNRQVRLTYRRIRVNDCSSNEPCGKNRWKKAIVNMTAIDVRRR